MILVNFDEFYHLKNPLLCWSLSLQHCPCVFLLAENLRKNSRDARKCTDILCLLYLQHCRLLTVDNSRTFFRSDLALFIEIQRASKNDSPHIHLCSLPNPFTATSNSNNPPKEKFLADIAVKRLGLGKIVKNL